MNKLLSLSTLVLLLVISFVHAKHYPELKWTNTQESVSNHEILLFKIYLKHQNLDLLSEKVRDVSSPKSPNYAKYLTKDEVMDIIAPESESIETIKNWVQSNHPVSIVDYKDALIVRMSKKNVEKMFNVKMEKYEHPSQSFVYRSSEDPVIPHKYSKLIDLISGISNFPVVESKRQSKVLSRNSMFLDDAASSSGSSSSSGSPPTGQFIMELLGEGRTTTIIYTPACNPDCGGKYFPVQATFTAINNPSNFTLTGAAATPTCNTNAGYPLCSVVVESIPYLPTTLTLFDTVAEITTVYPYTFVSTPVITPQAIKDYYGVPEGYVITTNVTQCVVEFEQQYMNSNDLETFFQEMGLPWDYQLEFIGPNTQSNPGIEASLDIQYIMGMAPGAPTTFWSIYANSTVEIDDILAWATAAFNSGNPPTVNSLSYGMTEIYVDKFQGAGYLARSDVEFQKLALLGVTIIIASGDSGSGDLGPAPMSASNCNTLHADWPSQSEYVTSVSSIYFTPLSQPICYGKGAIDCSMQEMGEVGVSIDYGMMWTGGGGFSNTSSTAYYQTAFVEQYLTEYSTLLPPSNLFNSSGRAYPDVSTVGHNLYIINANQWMTVDGTSASAPIFAGLVTILNDVRAKAGLSPLGFINPLLYQIAIDYPEAYYDVTVGNNRCGIVNQAGSPTCCPHGYEATPGFDVVSGLGRPNMEVLMRIITYY
ncbi:peptidase C53 family protein [Tieghemostelium lacteum]|uniref:Peptidase C53 family protein n=1 Tax=Tieghemostelium lacteum TaxID=361077 RepID=A0A151Z573_TIELA|nr:peptidase C53 family protein [Tieghemostelium lacteum]|eukprot:KYQ89129.1 peptidase C53 family protein [Tieghemostelium lacteum]